MAKDEDGNIFTDDDIFANVFSIMLAGKDAVALTLSWTINLITENPEVQESIQQEVDTVLENKQLEYSDLAKLKYIEVVLQESMRLKAIALMISVQANNEVEVMNLSFPKDTIFLMLSRADSYKDEYFSNASEFNPQRWLDQSANTEQQHCPMRSLPYGGGARFCSGSVLSMMEMKAVIAMICKKYILKKDPSATAVHEEYAFLMQPSGFKISIEKR